MNLKLLTFTLLLAIVSFNTMAQTVKKNVPPPAEFVFNDSTIIYEYVTEEPTFPGGSAAQQEFVTEHLRYPQDCIDKGIEGLVLLNVVINRNGYITDIEVLKGPPNGKALEAEAVRIYKNMPKWNPGKNHGETRNVRLREKIIFVLPKKNSK